MTVARRKGFALCDRRSVCEWLYETVRSNDARDNWELSATTSTTQGS